LQKNVTAKQVIRHLQSAIRLGQLNSGDKLPSERVLSEQLGTTRVTIREALKTLESDGLIFRSNRRGWFVNTQRISYNPNRSGFYMDYVAEQGFVPFSKQVSFEQVSADTELASIFNIAEGEPVARLSRIRGVDGRPVYVETIYLNMALLPDILQYDLSRSVSEVVKGHYAFEYAASHFDIRVGTLSDEQAAKLHAPLNFNCVTISRTVKNQHQQVFEYDLEYWRHDVLSLNFSIDQ
jgi:DNA-binding GntR family transcriptional regulator